MKFPQKIIGKKKTNSNFQVDSVKEYLGNEIMVNNLPPIDKQSLLDPHSTNELNEYLTGIAIVGMSCRTAGANNVEELWNLLMGGIDAVGPCPSDRLEETAEGPCGFLKSSLEDFDPEFFGISPQDASSIRPEERILLEVGWESLENAGISAQSLKNMPTRYYVGMFKDEAKSMASKGSNVHSEHDTSDLSGRIASTVSKALGLRESVSCYSSLSGLHLACESLRKGNISVAIASGVNVIGSYSLNPTGEPIVDEEYANMEKLGEHTDTIPR